MANYRQVHVSLWKDEWFLDLEPEQKLLFIYLFSNESTSLAGIYKLAFKVICFETNLDADYVRETLRIFAIEKKVYYQDGVVWVVNMRRYHETSSSKVQTRITNDIAEIPDCPLKIAYLEYINTVSIGYRYPNLKEEEEDKEEDEKEKEKEVESPNLDGVYADLSVAFCNKTYLPELTGGPQAWYESLNRMGEAGVMPIDIEKAVDILRDKGYPIVRLSSVENTAIGEMSKRLNPKGKKGVDISAFDKVREEMEREQS